MTSDMKPKTTPYAEHALAEMPSRDLWPNIASSIAYEQKLQQAMLREQGLKKRSRYLTLSLAASIALLISAISIHVYFTPKAGMSEHGFSTEFTALLNTPSAEQKGRTLLESFSKSTKFHIQYEDENMDKKTLAAGVFGLLAGSGTTLFVLDSNSSPEILANANTHSTVASATAPPPTIDAQNNNCTQVVPVKVTTAMCQTHIDAAVSKLGNDALLASKNNATSSITAEDRSKYTPSADSNSETDLVERFKKYQDLVRTTAPNSYYKHIPEGYEDLTRPMEIPENWQPKKNVLDSLEQAYSRSQEQYKTLEAFYDQGEEARNHEHELSITDASALTNEAGVTLDKVDCLGEQCFWYGRAQKRWQLEKFMDGLKSILGQMGKTTTRSKSTKNGEIKFIVHVDKRGLPPSDNE